MPASIAATNNHTSTRSVARFITAGPGQKPASPLARTKQSGTCSSLRSSAVDVGSRMGSPKTEVLRRLAQVKATSPNGNRAAHHQSQ